MTDSPRSQTPFGNALAEATPLPIPVGNKTFSFREWQPYCFKAARLISTPIQNQIEVKTKLKALYKLILRPLTHLWILFALHLAVLTDLLITLAICQPQYVHMLSVGQEAEAKAPLVEQSIDRADPERLRKLAHLFFDGASDQIRYSQDIETKFMQARFHLCRAVFVITVWFGLVTFQLQRANKKSQPLAE